MSTQVQGHQTHQKHLSNSSSISADSYSPNLSLFSSRPYTRFSGSSSSSLGPRDEDGLPPSKSYLTDVMEEPQERLEYVDQQSSQHDEADEALDSFGDLTLESLSPISYGLDDSQHNDVGLEPLRVLKSRRSTLDSPLPSVFHRASSLSLSRKLRAMPSMELHHEARSHSDEQLRHRTNSESSALSTPSDTLKFDCHWFPPSPARTEFDERQMESRPEPIDIARANLHVGEELRAQSTTPLLPPMLKAHARSVSPVNSPLQSPTVASSSRNSSAEHIPIEHVLSPTGTYRDYPSPPLSHQPSMSSVCGTIVPQEFHFVPLDQPEDKWSHILGHANFFISPEPYVPEIFDGAAYEELCQKWQCARQQYAKHLIRTQDNYGPTSQVYRFTEEKWAEIEQTWKRNMEAVLDNLKKSDGLFSLHMEMQRVRSVQLPKLDDSDGKFPDLGDEDIVGPMNVAPGACAGTSDRGRNSDKKKGFWQACRDMAGKAGLSTRTSRSSSAVGRLV